MPIRLRRTTEVLKMRGIHTHRAFGILPEAVVEGDSVFCEKSFLDVQPPKTQPLPTRHLHEEGGRGIGHEAVHALPETKRTPFLRVGFDLPALAQPDAHVSLAELCADDGVLRVGEVGVGNGKTGEAAPEADR